MDQETIGKELLELSAKVWDKYAGSDTMRDFLRTKDIDIRCTKSGKIGNCYYANYYTIVSKQKLTFDFMGILREAKVLGFGQDWDYTDAVQQDDGTWLIRVTDRCDSSG